VAERLGRPAWRDPALMLAATCSELLVAPMLIDGEEKMAFAVGFLTFVSGFSVD
jgi:hypothetical protein